MRRQSFFGLTLDELLILAAIAVVLGANIARYLGE